MSVHPCTSQPRVARRRETLWSTTQERHRLALLLASADDKDHGAIAAALRRTRPELVAFTSVPIAGSSARWVPSEVAAAWCCMADVMLNARSLCKQLATDRHWPTCTHAGCPLPQVSAAGHAGSAVAGGGHGGGEARPHAHPDPGGTPSR